MPFHNIFSFRKSKKKSNKQKPKIIADIHEKDSMILAEISENKEVELEIKPLKIGDYLIGNTIIERKTISDFVSSMLNKRLIEQLKNMKQYSSQLLIIEGELFKEDTSKPEKIVRNFLGPGNQKGFLGKPYGVLDNAIRGFILSIINNYQIPVIFTQNYEDTVQYLITLAKQQLKPKTEISLHSRIPSTLKEQKQYILEAFPNIGPITAKKLLKEFKTLSSIFNAKEEELKKVLRKKAVNFREILDK